MTSPEKLPRAITVQPASPRFPKLASPRRIAIAVDLSDESAHAVRWAVDNYLRPSDSVVLLHVRPTSVLYGADWGPTLQSSSPLRQQFQDQFVQASNNEDERKKHNWALQQLQDNSNWGPQLRDQINNADEGVKQQKLEEAFDNFTNTKAEELARPLVEAGIGFKIHIVRDHDMKERLCLEVERLGLSAVIMGSRGFGASRRSSKARLGSVSDYCVQHCVCPVVVVRYSDEKDGDAIVKGSPRVADNDVEGLHPVPEEEPVYHDASDV